jgi:hypothetical protein
MSSVVASLPAVDALLSPELPEEPPDELDDPLDVDDDSPELASPGGVVTPEPEKLVDISLGPLQATAVRAATRALRTRGMTGELSATSLRSQDSGGSACAAGGLAGAKTCMVCGLQRHGTAPVITVPQPS